MPDTLSLPVRDFLAATAAKTPTPGGGSIAALAGALAASLAAMAMEYTLGKKAYAAHDDQTRRALAGFQAASAMLQELLVEDIAAYQALSSHLKLPPADRLQNPDFLPAVVAAIRVPQTVAGFALNILDRCAAMRDKTNHHLISDLGIAAVYAHATVHAAELLVRVNLPLLPNQDEASDVRQSMSALTAKADAQYAAFRTALLTQI
jgi:glutamate formiminotransferase/formiminotetrahydrofolate cyclodeaminase